MKIDYDLTNCYKKLYNEANGIFLKRKKLLNNKKLRITSYTTNILYMALKYLLLFTVFGLVIYKIDSTWLLIMFIITSILEVAIIIIVLMTYIYSLHNYSKNNSKSGTLTINKEGIIDKENIGIVAIITYNNIELLVITKSIILFILKSSQIIFVSNEDNIDKDKMIKLINKFSKNTKIVEIK